MNQIKPGKHFRDAKRTLFGHLPPDWVVDRVFVGTDGKEYAEVYLSTNTNEKKTLSTAILLDKRRFIEVIG